MILFSLKCLTTIDSVTQHTHCQVLDALFTLNTHIRYFPTSILWDLHSNPFGINLSILGFSFCHAHFRSASAPSHPTLCIPIQARGNANTSASLSKDTRPNCRMPPGKKEYGDTRKWKAKYTSCRYIGQLVEERTARIVTGPQARLVNVSTKDKVLANPSPQRIGS